jgi:F0F1-type ATP synthase assembly protein I
MKGWINAGRTGNWARTLSCAAHSTLTNKNPLATMLVCAALVMLASSTTFAQGGGSTIFGQDETMIPNAVRYGVIFLFGIAFLFGAGSVVWGVMAYTRRQECMNWIIGGGLCMVVGGVVAGIAYIAGGNALAVPNDLSYLTTFLTNFA